MQDHYHSKDANNNNIQYEIFLKNEKNIYANLQALIQDKINKNTPITINNDKEINSVRQFGQNKPQKKQ